MNIDAPVDWGFIGNCYYDQNNTSGSTINDYRENWDNVVGTGAYTECSAVQVGTEWTWTFSNIWLNRTFASDGNPRFLFRNGNWAAKLGYETFNTITLLTGITLANNGGANPNSDIKITSQSTNPTQYNVVIR